jgi:hypothetical protein
MSIFSVICLIGFAAAAAAAVTRKWVWPKIPPIEDEEEEWNARQW